MYIHLGGEKIVRASELVAIFDISIEQSSKISKQFVVNRAKRKDVEIIGEEESKSIVVTKQKVYYSPISSSTLKKRGINSQIYNGE
jgi:extracellular matrix regulatory protein B